MDGRQRCSFRERLFVPEWLEVAVARRANTALRAPVICCHRLSGCETRTCTQEAKGAQNEQRPVIGNPTRSFHGVLFLRFRAIGRMRFPTAPAIRTNHLFLRAIRAYRRH
jgi:hypothetical protein